MDIDPVDVTVGELANGYKDNDEDGVVGYGGKLDVRPPYQREFVYKDKQRDAVIETVIEGYPLNVMYWAVRDDGGFEIIDGQQRTIALCQYVTGDFAFKDRYFHNLQNDEQQQILDYELTVYQCKGTDSEKLQWFKTINIAGEELTNQELRNAVYHGSWVTDAKKYFSKNGCPAYGLGGAYMTGTPIRQDYLETVIKWINGGDIEGYMAQRQHEPNANELWLYFQAVIAWVKAVFPKYRREMKGVAWGDLYNKYKGATLDPMKIEDEVGRLMADDDVTRKKGVYPYVLTRDEKHLSIRQFNNNEKTAAYERQKGKCHNGDKCKTTGNSDGDKVFPITEMEADHIKPWSKGGKTNADNCQMLCVACNRQKSNV